MNRLPFKLFFNLKSFQHQALFEKNLPVWNVIKNLKSYLDMQSLGKILCNVPKTAILIHPDLISIEEGTIIEPGAYIEGPCIIGKNCKIGHGCYLRPYVLTGDHCVIGHGTEVKHSIFFNGAKAPHFNYVGDSVLGSKVNLGAGVVCANFRLDQKMVSVRVFGKKFSTELKKFGAIVGDGSQIGCNTVLNPGVLLTKKSMIPSCVSISESNIRKETSHVYADFD